MNEITFERVLPTEEQIVVLYSLLREREHVISHREVSVEEHRLFVSNHPYRAWFLVRYGGKFIGSFYVSNENTIGVNLGNVYDVNLVSSIFDYVKKNFHPLKAIPSVRASDFAINVSPNNQSFIDALEYLGCKVAQVTYYLPH